MSLEAHRVQVASASGLGHALLGNTGDVSGEELTGWLRTLRFTGTLALTDDGGTMLLLLAKGQVEASFRLGDYEELGGSGQRFHLSPHEPTDLPRLPARNPGSASPLLSALPRLGPPDRLAPGATKLAAVLSRLEEHAFDGAFSYRSGEEHAVALLLQGSVRAAAHGGVTPTQGHAEAMRVLQRAEKPAASGRLELEAISADLIRPATALAQERTAAIGDTFSGLEVTPVGYRYWRAGQPFLLVPAETKGPERAYALPEDEREVSEEFALPPEPPGWEEQRYQMTLRGRDALDPMMELYMEFGAEYGAEGRELLTILGSGASLSECAAKLGFALDRLKPWLELFEAEGLLRRSSP